MASRTAFPIAWTLALALAGCSRHVNQATSASSHTAPPQREVAQTAPPGDANRGKLIYAEQCAQCHGVTGTEGHIGPSLANEKKRKTYAQTVVWIEDPTEPMPKLYPSPLSEKDVDDVASFVQTL